MGNLGNGAPAERGGGPLQFVDLGRRFPGGRAVVTPGPVEEGEHTKGVGTAHPDEAPTTRPDLGQIRTELDRLTTALLGELKSTVDVRTGRTP